MARFHLAKLAAGLFWGEVPLCLKKTGRCISLSQKLSRYIQSPEIQGEILLYQTDSTLLFLMLIYGHELNQVKY